MHKQKFLYKWQNIITPDLFLLIMLDQSTILLTESGNEASAWSSTGRSRYTLYYPTLQWMWIGILSNLGSP